MILFWVNTNSNITKIFTIEMYTKIFYLNNYFALHWTKMNCLNVLNCHEIVKKKIFDQ